MPTRKFPQLFRLRHGQVLELVRDLHSFVREYKVILAVDSHELFDYCFPINPTEEHRDIDPEEVAESQAALHHLFKATPKRPPVILLPEYRDELRGLLDTIERQSGPVYDTADMISKMIKAGDLDNITEMQAAELESVVQNSFQFLLTVLLGIHSLGVARMKEAYDKGLTEILDAIEPEDRDYFSRIWDGYERSGLYNIIFNALQADSGSELDPIARANAERANRYDAGAIHRLIYLNTVAEHASDKKLLKNRYLFLYLSTTRKSRKVFNLPAVKAALPKISGREYPFLRDRHQVLTYLIYWQRDPDATRSARKTVSALRSLNVLLGKVREFEQVYKREADGCRECVLEGKLPKSCTLLNYCHEVNITANKIKAKREEVNNWGLFQEVHSYAYLRDSQVTELRMGYKIYMQLFADILDSPALKSKDFALERIYQRHIWISRASEWTLLTNRIREGFDPSKEIDLRSEKDQIMGIDQHLPSKPRFQSAAYKDILSLILGFYRQPKRVELLDDAYRKFLDLEPDAKQDDDEYDLLRSYLYMMFGFENNIHSHVKEILLPKLGRTSGGDINRESMYVLCWSARRSGFYEEAHGYAQRGIKQYPNDPRFFNGRALNIYAWLEKRPEECRYRIADAIADSRAALDLYQRDALDNRELIAACHNNIAYLLALDAKFGESYTSQERTQLFEEALEHIENLKTLFDKKTGWNPAHPEFFHTEAFIAYQMALHYWIKNERTEEELLEQLRGARNDIKIAIDIYDRRKYRDLRDEIDGFYQKLDSKGH